MTDADAGGKAARKRGAKIAAPDTRELDFEASIQRLEAIVGRLEAGELPLEESLRLFEEGQTLVRSCSTLLERAEQRVKELLEGTGETRDVAPPGAGGAGVMESGGRVPAARGPSDAPSGDAASFGPANREGPDE